ASADPRLPDPDLSQELHEGARPEIHELEFLPRLSEVCREGQVEFARQLRRPRVNRLAAGIGRVGLKPDGDAPLVQDKSVHELAHSPDGRLLARADPEELDVAHTRQW